MGTGRTATSRQKREAGPWDAPYQSDWGDSLPPYCLGPRPDAAANRNEPSIGPKRTQEWDPGEGSSIDSESECHENKGKTQESLKVLGELSKDHPKNANCRGRVRPTAAPHLLKSHRLGGRRSAPMATR